MLPVDSHLDFDLLTTPFLLRSTCRRACRPYRGRDGRCTHRAHTDRWQHVHLLKVTYRLQTDAGRMLDGLAMRPFAVTWPHRQTWPCTHIRVAWPIKTQLTLPPRKLARISWERERKEN
jgi:hypothetical protein